MSEQRVVEDGEPVGCFACLPWLALVLIVAIATAVIVRSL